VKDVGADFYAGNLHKWLLAPIGAGFLAIRDGNEDRLQPQQVSWGYHPDRYPNVDYAPRGHEDDRDEFGSTPRTRFLEFDGTKDICPWLAVPDAIHFQAALGWQAVRDRIAELAAFTRQRFAKLGLKLATPDQPGMHGALTAHELPPGRTAKQWRELVWKHRIEVPIIERPNRLLIRVSHHFYTTEAEIDFLVDRLREWLAGKE
jgi:isopenicillin-N epimerase